MNKQAMQQIAGTTPAEDFFADLEEAKGRLEMQRQAAILKLAAETFYHDQSSDGLSVIIIILHRMTALAREESVKIAGLGKPAAEVKSEVKS